MKPPLPSPTSAVKGAYIQAENQLCHLLQSGQGERWQALAAYVAALPVETGNHWELLRCIVLDLAALRQRQHAEDDR